MGPTRENLVLHPLAALSFDNKLVIIFYQVPSIFRPDSTFGSVTETIDKMIEEYVTRELNRIALPIKGAQEFDPEEFRVSDCLNCHLSSCIMRTKNSLTFVLTQNTYCLNNSKCMR